MQESEWRKLVDAGLALHSELALGAVLGTLAQRASELTGAKEAAIGVLDRSGAGFEYTVGSAELLHRATDGPSADRTLVVPLAVRGAPYARLVIGDKRDEGIFTSEDEAILSVLTQHAAVAIENARRYESATRWLAQLESLSEIGNALASEHDLSRLLQGVVERLRELLTAGTLFVALPAADGDLEIRAADGEATEKLIGFRLPRRGSKAGRVFDRGRSEKVDVTIEDVEVYQPLARRWNFRAGLFVPLLAGDEPIGMLVAANKLGGDGAFSDGDLHLAEAFAARVAVAVELAAPGKTGSAGTDERGAEAAFAGLTPREVEVLRLVAYGMSDAQIAERLVVSQRTVHAHLRSVYRKLEVNSRSAATRWAVEHRLA